MKKIIEDKQLRRSIIMDHYSYPRHKSLKNDESYHQKHMASSSCIDDITVQLKVSDQKVVDVCFDGVGCAISIASTSIMSDLLIGKSTQDALYILQQYQLMMEEKEYDIEVLKEALAFCSLPQQASRINCATIGTKAMKILIDEWESE